MLEGCHVRYFDVSEPPPTSSFIFIENHDSPIEFILWSAVHNIRPLILLCSPGTERGLRCEIVDHVKELIDGFQARALFKHDAGSQFRYVGILGANRETVAIIDK